MKTLLFCLGVVLITSFTSISHQDNPYASSITFHQDEVNPTDPIPIGNGDWMSGYDHGLMDGAFCNWLESYNAPADNGTGQRLADYDAGYRAGYFENCR